MATVYASLLSLIKVINRTQNPLSPYAYLTRLHTQPLLDRVTFLLQFVEDFSHHTRRSQEVELLETRITLAAYSADDIIESFLVYQIHRNLAENITTVDEKQYAISSEHLVFAVQEMDSIMKEVWKIKDEFISKHANENDQTADVPSTSSSAATRTNGVKKNYEDLQLTKLREKLTTLQPDRVVIPITGMGGIGKTTLATNIYDDPFVKYHFITRAWATISQDYSLRNIFLCLLYDTGLFKSTHKNFEAFANSMHDKSDDDLGQKLYQTLFQRKYLVILDDIWSTTAWDELSRFFPDNGNGSRILMTTRLLDLTLSLGSSNHYEMKFLDDDVSWKLLSEIVFDGGEKSCPPQLEEIGKIIARNCGGLPLAIVVMGGLLKVSEKTHVYWNEVVENVSYIVNNENDKQCLRILSLSYDHLPIQLKPLFLYMAIFPKDREVSVSRLIKLWIAEGFVKPPANINESLEDVAENYLKDLTDRNLLMVHKLNSRGKIKTCKIHDLLRDLSLREAHKKWFLCMLKLADPREDIAHMRRLGMHSNPRLRPENQQVLLARTVFMEKTDIRPDIIFFCKLLRVLHAHWSETYRLRDILNFVNSRYLDFSSPWYLTLSLPLHSFQKSVPSNKMLSLPWNLETLLVDGPQEGHLVLPSSIWEMQHLRHVKFEEALQLSMPDGENNHFCVLDNLQTLSKILNFEFTDEILGRIPNLKKLGFEVNYKDDKEEEEKELHFNHNLVLLRKLEILSCSYFVSNKYRLKIRLDFPPSLRKLSLNGSRIPWENMSIVGSLPKLEVLILRSYAFCGSKWILTEEDEDDQFQCLKYLKVDTSDLEIWEADGTNFPSLESLVLENCKELEEIPWGIGEIPSLLSIKLVYCSISVVNSAKEILLEAQNQGNDDLQVEVEMMNEDVEMQNLASPNFRITYVKEIDKLLEIAGKLHLI